MKSINAKKIAAVVTGAALLGAGLAFAGPVTFQSVPIISNSGQPVVQIVIGSQAKPWDGVSAGNIAAAIGNLAYTSTPVTASVNATQAASVLHVAVSSPVYSLANQQVWLNESGVTSATGGTYLFSALIGSVLNQGVQLGTPQNTKALSTSTSYTFSSTSLSTSSSPLPSPYKTVGSVPFSTSVTASYNGGGVSFTAFRSSSSDNILQVGSSQFSKLLSNSGTNGETEYLWVTGFPVYDQVSNINNFRLLDAGGAYQLIFNKPIANTLSNGGTQINVPITLLGQNFTIINATGGLASVAGSNQYVAGGSAYLASALAPLQTIYVGHNITTGPWTVSLQDLGQPNSNGVSPASIAVYYNNVLTNVSSVNPSTTAQFNVSGKLLYVQVNSTFAGLYAYQKWAKMQLLSNVYKVQNGHVLNQTTNPGWYTDLLWTNTTSATGKANQLYSIVIYNVTPSNLAPGQSFSFIQDPSMYKLTFLGETLGTGSYDSVSISTQTGSVQYQNTLGTSGTGLTGTITNITEPAQELIVTSQIPNAFTYQGQTSSSVTYLLTPMALNVIAANVPGLGTTTGTYATLVYKNPEQASASTSPWFGSTNPLTVTVTGYTTSNTLTSQVLQYTYNTITSSQVTNTLPLSTALFNVTSIQLQNNQALPIGSTGAFYITVGSSNAVNAQANVINVVEANMIEQQPGVLYPLTGKVYEGLAIAGAVNYNQQNGQPTTTLALAAVAPSSGTGIGKYATFTMSENPVGAANTTVDSLGLEIQNSTAGVQATPLFNLNYSTSGTHNNNTYTSYSGSGFDVKQGFRTERGSKIASITPTQVTWSLATAVDMLQFAVSGAGNATVNRAFSLHGPYSVGQATNLPNVSIAKVTANVTLSGSSNYTITGISDIQAVPSVASATTPVLLTGLSSTTPLVVLDSAATQGSNLILVGSGYVNTLSKQLEQSYNITGDLSATGTPVVQAYGTNRILVAGFTANQTNAAANHFIDELYAAAATT